MEENADSSRFGLEVICHRSDRRLPELTNYKHRVGASLKPKLIKPGKIWVRLKSQLFEADVEAGEDPEMLKEECDFRGRDFEKQYACRFKTGVVVGRGTFGKVTVERSVAGGLEAIFEFNLHKVSWHFYLICSFATNFISALFFFFRQATKMKLQCPTVATDGRLWLSRNLPAHCEF